MLSQWIHACGARSPDAAKGTFGAHNHGREPRDAHRSGRARYVAIVVAAVLGLVTLTLGLLGPGEPVRGVRAQPAPPATYAGSVVGLGGAPVVEGTVVEARIGLATCGVAQVFVVDGQARYKVHVAAAGPEAGPCGVPGALVTFYAGGEYAGFAYWESGLTLIDLVAVRPRPPQTGGGPDATPGATPQGGTGPEPTTAPRPPTTAIRCDRGDPLPPECGTHRLTRDETTSPKDPAKIVLLVGFLNPTSVMVSASVLTPQERLQQDCLMDLERLGIVAPSMSANVSLTRGGDALLTYKPPGSTPVTATSDDWPRQQRGVNEVMRWEWSLSPGAEKSGGRIDYTVTLAIERDGEDRYLLTPWDCTAFVRSDDTPTPTPTHSPTPTQTAVATPAATATPRVPTNCPPNCPATDDGFPKWLFLLAVPAAGLLGGAGWAKRKPIIAFATYRMTPPTVFLSYRRDDKDRAELISVSLNAKLGRDHVFHDVRDLTAGEDFPDALAKKITGCDVLLAIIGKTWLGIKDDGTRRIDAENDWVRKEVAHALSAGKGVIPVLVDGASLPKEDELPGDLSDLRNKNSRPIAGGENYEVSIDRLVHGIYLEAKRSRVARKTRPSAAVKQ